MSGASDGGKPRLVIATDNFLPRWDGIARFLAEVIPRLKDEYEITVVSPDYGLLSHELGVERVLVPLSKRCFGDYTPARLAPRLVGEAVARADIVFSQTIGPIGLLAHLYARRYEKPLAAFIHSIEWELVPKALNLALLKGLTRPLLKGLACFLYNRCSLLIVPSRNIADLLTWQRVITRKMVVHLGVDARRFSPGDREAAREELRLPRRAFIIGFHGRLGYEKNLLTLSRAFLRIRVKQKRLLLIGEGASSLRERVARVKGVILPGAVNNVVPYLRAMDLYVMPSFTETTSLAVLEAMAVGLPVIASPVGFIQQYIVEGKNGFFFETKSAYQLSKRLEGLAANPALRERVGRAARATVVKNFQWRKTAEGIAAALATLRRGS